MKKSKKYSHRYYIKGYRQSPRRDFKYPCFVLVTNTWNDFGFETMFSLFFYESENERTEIGGVKILSRGEKSTLLNNEFKSLDSKKYCSLGQTISYYHNLIELFDREESEQILDALNDIAYYTGLRDDFRDDLGFKTSLLRFKEAQKAYVEGRKIILGIEIDNAFIFNFRCLLPGASEEHSVDFEFSKDSMLINRIYALIGRNGTGKTLYLAKMANSMSGLDPGGSFNSEFGPPFSKVITVSYSLFDKFKVPKRTKSFSYVYCGLRDQNDNLDENTLSEKLKKAIIQLVKRDRYHLYLKYLEELITNINFLSDLEDNEETIRSVDFNLLSQEYNLFSSGQTALIYILAEIIANIEKESLILFDEPETHLHPNAIIKLVKVLNLLLKKFDSYAILATHSPQIVQQIFSKNVIVFDRVGNVPFIRKLDIESFGENLTTINQVIFETVEIDEFYKEEFTKLLENHTYEEISKFFRNKLSFNAALFLKNVKPK